MHHRGRDDLGQGAARNFAQDRRRSEGGRRGDDHLRRPSGEGHGRKVRRPGSFRRVWHQGVFHRHDGGHHRRHRGGRHRREGISCRHEGVPRRVRRLIAAQTAALNAGSSGPAFLRKKIRFRGQKSGKKAFKRAKITLY